MQKSTPAAELTVEELLAEQHPAVADAARFIVEVNPNLPPLLRSISQRFADLAVSLLGDGSLGGAQLTRALHKLTEAKDCAVRAAL